jgi:hypothetical protein
MDLNEIIAETEKNTAKHARDTERLNKAITDALGIGRFPATNHLKALAAARIERDLWKLATGQLQRLDASADIVTAAQVLRQIADAALANVLLPGDSTDGFTRAQMAAEREGYSNFYREAVATADYISEQ